MKLERFQFSIFWGNDFSQHFVTSNWLYCFPAESRRFFIFSVTNNSMAEKFSKEKRIDETNKKLLQLLQKDSKQSIAKLSEVLGIGISSVHARMKTLKDLEYMVMRIQVVAQLYAYHQLRIPWTSVIMNLLQSLVK